MTGIVVMAILALSVSLALSLANYYLIPDRKSLTDKINQLLPQTQCGQCGYPGCRPYAQAIAEQQVPINQCPPGGDTVINALSDLLNRPIEPLNPQCGQHKPASIAVIDELQCIGCALCLPACPVDAIVGAPKYLHRIINQQCTGCELCLDPCPVDCIRMEPLAPQNPLPLPAAPSKPCIRCDRCKQVCPVLLDAQTLYHQIRLHDITAAETVTTCIECGHCADACPSQIPLLDFYRYGKQQIHLHLQQQQQAQQAEQHYRMKTLREKREREQQNQTFSRRQAILKSQIQKNQSCQN